MKQAGTAWAALCALITVAWVVIAFGGGGASPVSTTALGAAGAAGTAALLGAGWRPRSLEALQVGGLLLVGLPAAVAAAAGGSTALLAAGLALVATGEAAVALAVRRRVGVGVPAPSAAALLLSPGTLVAGCGLLVASLLAERADALRWVLPGQSTTGVALALAGAALLAAAAAIGPPRAWAPAVAGMIVALPAAAQVPALAGAAGAGAVAVAAAALTGRPSLVLSALALAAAASSPALGPAAPLLAAAAVLALAVEHPAGVALGLPGTAALAALAVPSGRSASQLVVAAAAAAAALALALRASSPGGVPAPVWSRRLPTLEAGPALALGAWLLLAPGRWAWTGSDGAGAYDRGATVALAGGALAALVATATARRPATAAPEVAPSRPGEHARLAVEVDDRVAGDSSRRLRRPARRLLAVPGPRIRVLRPQEHPATPVGGARDRRPAEPAEPAEPTLATGPAVVPIPMHRRGRLRRRAQPRERGDG